MKNTTEILFSLIREEICGKDFTLGTFDAENLFNIVKHHDIAYIIAKALSKKGKLTDNFKKEEILTIYRYESQRYELDRISSLFEEYSIDYLSLKGANISAYYPDPIMRTSCDIDILIKEKDLDKAIKLLEEKFSFKRKKAAEYRNASLYSPSGVHLELHFNILENMENVDRLLSRVWEHTTLATSHGFKMDNNYFVFYTIAHIVQHLSNNGMGIRPFIDLWILKNKVDYDENLLREYLRECEVEKFYDNVNLLLSVWFEGKEHTDLTLRMEEYIVEGGIYGKSTNLIAIKKNRSGSFGAYLKSRIILPYDTIKYYYPVLKKHKWLTPFYEVIRWCRVATNGIYKRIIREIKTSRNLSNENTQKISDFLKEIGL